MSKKVDNEAIASFLKEQSNGDVDHFGYLLIPDDARLNDEALSYIKDSWHKFLVDGGYEL